MASASLCPMKGLLIFFKGIPGGREQGDGQELPAWEPRSHVTFALPVPQLLTPVCLSPPGVTSTRMQAHTCVDTTHTDTVHAGRYTTRVHTTCTCTHARDSLRDTCRWHHTCTRVYVTPVHVTCTCPRVRDTAHRVRDTLMPGQHTHPWRHASLVGNGDMTWRRLSFMSYNHAERGCYRHHAPFVQNGRVVYCAVSEAGNRSHYGGRDLAKL